MAAATAVVEVVREVIAQAQALPSPQEQPIRLPLDRAVLVVSNLLIQMGFLALILFFQLLHPQEVVQEQAQKLLVLHRELMVVLVEVDRG